MIFCRVDASLTLDDLDYDIVRYDYEWRVNGQVVRQVTSAGRADAIPKSFAQPGALVSCTVTAKDEWGAAAAPVVAQATVSSATYDCNGNFIDDAIDIANGTSADLNGNGQPDECEANVLYVDASAAGANRGTSWTDAYTDLQDALRVALASRPGGPSEIWVAAGTYTPDSGCGDRTRSFSLIEGVSILGGFNGTETSPDQRDPAANVTILSGDLLGDDAPSFTNRTDNSYHVVRSGFVDATAVLDGFTIRGGYANGTSFSESRGAGAWIEWGSPTFVRCSFEGNHCDQYGGAVHIQTGAAPSFSDCRFVRNQAGVAGGAVQVYYATASFSGGHFVENSCVHDGGAVRVHFGEASLEGVELAGNHAAGFGGAIATWSSTLSCEDCIWTANTTDGGGGAFSTDSDFAIRGCRFDGNRSLAGEAGAIWIREPAVGVLSQTDFLGNSSFYSGGAIQSNADVTLRDCRFEQNDAGSSGGAIRFLPGPAPTVERCQFVQNSAAGSGGGLLLADQSGGEIRDCLFEENTAPVGGAIQASSSVGLEFVSGQFVNNSADVGGAVGLSGASVVKLRACGLQENSANAIGGGAHVGLGSTLVLTNTVLDRNNAERGAGVYNSGSLDLLHVSAAGNVATIEGGAVFSEPAASGTLTNSILWGNSAPTNSQISDPLLNLLVTYSCVQGAWPGAGNINLDPAWFDAANGDLHLTLSSPCIDVGNKSVPGLPRTDFEGDPRCIAGDAGALHLTGPVTRLPAVDMGADEYSAVSSGSSTRR